MTRTYSHLITLPTYDERLRYLQLGQGVCCETFGSSRYLNQAFYHSKEWQLFRNRVIARDFGCDLGILGCEINGSIYIHHINPLLKADIISKSGSLFDMENVICVSFDTHQAIHYGFCSDNILFVERKPGDTSVW